MPIYNFLVPVHDSDDETITLHSGCCSCGSHARLLIIRWNSLDRYRLEGENHKHSCVPMVWRGTLLSWSKSESNYETLCLFVVHVSLSSNDVEEEAKWSIRSAYGLSREVSSRILSSIFWMLRCSGRQWTGRAFSCAIQRLLIAFDFDAQTSVYQRTRGLDCWFSSWRLVLRSYVCDFMFSVTVIIIQVVPLWNQYA